MPSWNRPSFQIASRPWHTNRRAIYWVVIGSNVTSIGERTFEDCGNLRSVTFSNSLTRIDQSAFKDSNMLASITIPNTVKTIGVAAFADCTRLASLTISNSVTTISDNAFVRCTSLTSVTIPMSVTKLGIAFQGCTGIMDVTVGWLTPLKLFESLYSGDNTVYRYFANLDAPSQRRPTLHVPPGTENLYKEAQVWRFFNIVPNTVGNETIKSQSLKACASDGILLISGLVTGAPLSIYNLSGQLFYQGLAKAEEEQIPLNTQGVYIVVAGNQRIKTIVK